MDFDIDIATIGYPAVRLAFNETRQLCVEKLTKADLRQAQDILGLDMLDAEEHNEGEILVDTALYSFKDPTGADKRRAIDRIAPRLPVKLDPIRSAITAQLPFARFSVFVVERAHDQGGIWARDLLNEGTAALQIMDQALAAQVTTWGEFPITGQFVDLGPWYIGSGIVVLLRKSETVAIRLAFSDGEGEQSAQEALHELVYPAHQHGTDLVMAALEPMITALALAIDGDMFDLDDLVAGLPAMLPSKPAPKQECSARRS